MGVRRTNNRDLFLLGAILAPLVLAVIGSRWLSRIEVGPVYFLDIVLAVSSFSLLFFGKFSLSGLPRVAKFSLGMVGALVLISFARLLLGEVSRDALVDFAPFLYFAYAVLLVVFGREILTIEYRRIDTVIYSALLFHSVWVFFVSFTSSARLELGSFEVSIRPDFDGMLCGALAAASLSRFIHVSGQSKLAYAVVSVLAALQSGLSGSTAAYIALIAMMIFVVIGTLAMRKSGLKVSTPWNRAIGGLALAAVACLLPLVDGLGNQARDLTEISRALQTDPAQGRSPANSTELENSDIDQVESPGGGTAAARLNAWVTLSKWLVTSGDRLYFGTGMGSDYFEASGALERLVGNPELAKYVTKHPHNFLLHIWAVHGVVVALAMSLAFLWLLMTSLGKNRHFAIWSVLFVGTITTSMFGVVFEAPFGAVVLATCVGAMISHIPNSGGLTYRERSRLSSSETDK